MGRSRPNVPLPRRTLRLLVQPIESETCAMASVAMVAGVTLDEAIAAAGMLGPSHGTHDPEVKRALARLDVRHGEWVSARKGTRRTIPEFCIATIEDNRSNWAHAVAVLDGFVYDPSIGWPLPLRVYEDFIIDGTYRRPTSRARWQAFLPILSEPPR
jgi:hypothetical protein